MEKSIEINDINLMSILFGKLDENIALIEKELGLIIKSKADKIFISGEEDIVEDGAVL